MRKIVAMVVGIGLGLCFFSVLSYADDSTAFVSAKLDKISETQAQILQKLDEIKSELNVIKVRASQG